MESIQEMNADSSKRPPSVVDRYFKKHYKAGISINFLNFEADCFKLSIVIFCFVTSIYFLLETCHSTLFKSLNLVLIT